MGVERLSVVAAGDAWYGNKGDNTGFLKHTKRYIGGLCQEMGYLQCAKVTHCGID